MRFRFPADTLRATSSAVSLHASRARLTAVCLSLALAAPAVHAQDRDDKPARPILSIGDYPNVNGLRLNFRDSDLGRVNGINVTVWTPYKESGGTVHGVALGLPMTGADDIGGLALGVAGIGAGRNLTGITLGGLGAGAGGRVKGIAVGGLGVGAGGKLEGVMLGGLGVGGGGDAIGLIGGGLGAGVGGDIRGIAIGGLGVGGGGNATGLVVGGLGAGVGGNIRGIALGGLGAGGGGDLTGIAIGGIGVGLGGSVKGVLVGGVGAGVGGRIDGAALGAVGVGAGDVIHGIAVAGVGVGAPRLEGGFAALFVGARDAHAVVIAPLQFRIEDGSFEGASVSISNYIKGSQHGLTIGLLNYARSLNGVQVGILNIVADAKGHPILPLLNWGSR